MILSTGCTAEWAQRSADRQVYALLKDRKLDALGYSPPTIVEPVGPDAAPTSRPSRKAYDAIPVTPIPPPAAAAVEMPQLQIPAGPLGPFPEDLPPPPDKQGQRPMQAIPVSEERVPDIAAETIVMGPPVPAERAMALDLFGSIAFAVQHSPNYRDQMDVLYIAALEVTLQRHLLSPRPFARVGLLYDGSQADAGYDSALRITSSLGVRQRLPYGGEIVAEALANFVQAIDGNVANAESATLALSGSLPLLRGAGLVNLEPLIQSERSLVYEVRDFEEFRREFALQVATQYFRLVAQLRAVGNRRQNVANLTLLLQRARELYEAAPRDLPGRLSYLEVQRSEANLLRAQDALLQAQQTYLNTLDDFKILVGMPVEQELEIIPVALDVSIPEVEKFDEVELARQYRLDLQTARDQVEDALRATEVARNGLLPELDLVLRGAIGNRDNEPARKIDSDTLTYSAGVELDLPVDRLPERNVFRRAQIAFHRSRRDYEDLLKRVAADVRAAVRGIRQAQSSLVIQRRSIDVAEQRLEYAYILLQQGGRINTRDVVEAQQELLTAQDSYTRAQADLQVQVLQFLRETGTLRVDPEAGTLGRAMDGPRVERREIDELLRAGVNGPPPPPDAVPPLPGVR